MKNFRILFFGDVVGPKSAERLSSSLWGLRKKYNADFVIVNGENCASGNGIDKGGADMILAFEELEALRALPYLKKGGKIIVNTQRIDPMPVITGAVKYPENIIETLISSGADVTAADALELALKAGNIKAVNVVLIGIMAKNTSVSKKVWVDTIKKTVPEKFLDVNLAAFELGYNL